MIGFIIGIPALRMRGDYLAIITLGFGEIIRVVANALPITGGAMGLSGIPAYTNFTNAYWVMIISVFVIYAFIKSRHGRAVHRRFARMKSRRKLPAFALPIIR